MAEPLLVIDADATEVLAAIARLGDEAAERHILVEAQATAKRVAATARGRARRDTGAMADAVTVDAAPGPLSGFRVYVGTHIRRGVIWHPSGNFAIWHEFGTVTMTAAPFLIPAGQLEEGPYLRRVAEALQTAIDEQGLGA